MPNEKIMASIFFHLRSAVYLTETIRADAADPNGRVREGLKEVQEIATA